MTTLRRVSLAAENGDKRFPDIVAQDPKKDYELYHGGEHSVSRFSKGKMVAAFVCTFGCMIQCASQTVLVPFYPKVAQSKGNDATEVGIVFSVYPFIGFISSPVIGKMLSKTGTTKNMLIQGLLIDGVFLCLMVPAILLRSSAIFFLSSAVIRSIEALGYSMALTCYYTLISIEFPDDIAILIPIVETLFGVGVMLGPAVGGPLYEIGGYPLPYITFGVISIAFAGIAFVLLPRWESNLTVCGEADAHESAGMTGLLRDPRISSALLIVAACCTANGFNAATLALHINRFSLSTLMSSTVFLSYGVCYAIFSFMSGLLCKIMRDCRVLLIGGALCHVVGMSLQGPLPFIPLQTSVPLIIVGQCLMGIGHGGVFNCAYIFVLRHATRVMGFADSDRTYALVAGLFSAAFFFGSFAGPILGGVVLDTMGFVNGAFLMAGITVSLVLPATPFYIMDIFHKQNPKPVGLRGKSFNVDSNNRIQSRSA